MNYEREIKNQAGPGSGKAPVFKFGRFRFFTETAELFRGRKKIPLKVQSARVLAILLENSGRLVTRNKLVGEIWPDRTVEFDLSLNTCIRDIRHALGDTPREPVYIETLAKRGYRFKYPANRMDGIPAPKPRLKILALAAAAGLVLYLGHGQSGPPKPVSKNVSEEARALVVEGVSFIYDSDIPRPEDAIEMFRKAIALDPQYEEAHLMLARTVLARGKLAQIPLAEKSLAAITNMDPANGEAYLMAGTIRWAIYHDFRGAKVAFEKAAEFDPNSNQAYVLLAGYYSVMGDFDESIRKINLALNLNTVRLTENAVVGWFYYLAGRPSEGLKFCDQTRSVNPKSEKTIRCYLDNLMVSGDRERAAPFALALLKLNGLGEAETERLEAAGASAILFELYRQDAGRTVRPDIRSDPAFLEKAAALVRIGRKDEAVEILDAALKGGNFYLPFVRVLPDFVPLNDHPGFIALLSAMGLSSPPDPLRS